MKAEREGDEPEAARGEPAPAQVAHDHAVARDAVELAEQGRELGAGEVVEDLRAEHDVHAPRREGERERVARHRVPDPLSRDARERLGRVEADGAQGKPRALGERVRGLGEVAVTRADVEQRDRRGRVPARQRAQRVVEREQRGAAAAEPAVGARDVGDGAGADVVGDVRVVEQLDAAAARRREEVPQRSSSA